MSLRQKYKVESLLGQGLFGKVYLVTLRKGVKDGKRYALKVEHVFSEEDPYLQNELEFHRTVAKKHRKQFLQLKEFQYMEPCKEKSPPLPLWIRPSSVYGEYLMKLRTSGVCIYKIYSFLDGTLEMFSTKDLCAWSLPLKYSFLAQMFHSLSIMNQHDWVHGDLHIGNIGFKKTKKSEQIEIDEKQIPSFGKRFVPIDYGMVLNRYLLSPYKPFQGTSYTEQEYFELHQVMDPWGLLKLFFDFRKWKKHRGELSDQDKEFKIKQMYKTVEFQSIQRMTNQMVNRNHPFYTVQRDLFLLLFPRVFQSLFSNTLDHEKPIREIPIVHHLPLEDVLFCAIHLHDLQSIVDYFVSKFQ